MRVLKNPCISGRSETCRGHREGGAYKKISCWSLWLKATPHEGHLRLRCPSRCMTHCLQNMCQHLVITQLRGLVLHTGHRTNDLRLSFSCCSASTRVLAVSLCPALAIRSCSYCTDTTQSVMGTAGNRTRSAYQAIQSIVQSWQVQEHNVGQ